MNLHGIWAIYKFEMHRFMRTLMTGLIASAVLTLVLWLLRR